MYHTFQRFFSMDMTSIKALSEMGIFEDPGFVNQWQMNSLDNDQEPNMFPLGTTLGIGENFQHPYHYSHSTFKPSVWDSSNAQMAVDHDHQGLNYAGQVEFVKPKEESFASQNYVIKANQLGANKRITNKLSHAKDHILAERKRREKLSQKFIALSAIVPGLKKMDKASVLGDAIKYMKQLQEKVRALEEQVAAKKSNESVVFVKKSRLSFIGEKNETFEEPLPEIEARVCETNVLIRIHCEKRKGVLEKTVSEVEKLHLTVVNSSCLTFGSSALDLTIIAQMNLEFSLTMKDLVENLRSSFA